MVVMAVSGLVFILTSP